MSGGRVQVVRDAALDELPGLLRELQARRLLVISGPSRRHVNKLVLEPEFSAEFFDEARRHVPRELVEQASVRLERSNADTVIALGGGSSTGLGKALRLRHDFRFVVIPTTYSGSEYTTLYGVTDQGRKQTGRDARVRPDLVLRDPSLTRDMPLDLTVASLLNAMAHPLARLADDELPAADAEQAQTAINSLVQVLELLLVNPTSSVGRQRAFAATALAAQAIEAGALGRHHALVHLLGGTFDLDHAALHSVLLPHSVRALRLSRAVPMRTLARALDLPDLEAWLFDCLRRGGCATSLGALGLDHDQLEPLFEQQSVDERALLSDAFHGRRPLRTTRRQDFGLLDSVSVTGPELASARRVVLCIHGRGSNADAILERAQQILGDDPSVALVAPQARGNRWYKRRNTESRQVLAGELVSALDALERVARRILEQVEPARLVLFGFSQGACLALELFIKLQERLAGVVALSGARIGLPGEGPSASRKLAGTPVLLGKSDGDPWLPWESVESVAGQLQQVGCDVMLEWVPGSEHGFHAMHRVKARPLLAGRERSLLEGGFGAFHESEDLPGALPRAQNSPWPAPYGLVAEQVNATGFCVGRQRNQRSWLYRVRPSAQQREYAALSHPKLVDDFADKPPLVNLTGYRPLALPEEPADFVDGLRTLGGAGSPALRRGFAIHLYAANRSMEQRAFSCADGSLLIVPELGELVLLTELGILEVAPGSVALIPRGLRFSVLLGQAEARGYVAEVFGRAFELPERGPLGANSLADARHFRAPAAWHENRISVGYALVLKAGGKLHRATQDYSPFDVVAWHGNYAPYVYDLQHFSPVFNARFDHSDPSVFTVLSAPMDEPGSNTLDFVAFVPRWDATEHTFRPPYFHRNATTEINGIIRGGLAEGFETGCCFVTPALVPHGIVADRIPNSVPERAAPPLRPNRGALWFQFETSLPFSLTHWAETAPHRIEDWRAVWGGYRSRFDTELSGARADSASEAPDDAH